MAIDSALRAGREAALALMSDTCRITIAGARNGGISESTGKYTTADPVVVYEGPCRIPKRAAPFGTGAVHSGEAAWEVGAYPLDLPYEGSGEVTIGQTVTYLSSAWDEELPGHVFGITEVIRQSHSTKRRFIMKEGLGA